MFSRCVCLSNNDVSDVTSEESAVAYFRLIFCILKERRKEKNDKYQHSRFLARDSKSRPMTYGAGVLVTERQVGTVTTNLTA